MGPLLPLPRGRPRTQVKRTLSFPSSSSGEDLLSTANTNMSSNTKRLLFVSGLCLIPFIHFVFFRDNPPSLDPILAEANDSARYADAPHCTFQELADSFPNPQLAPNRQRTQNGQCWKLDDEVTQVPPAAIVNRNRLPKLGQGKGGAVFRALIELPRSGNKICYCALKTDLCQESLFYKKEDSVSCVKDGSYLMKGFSFLMGEYTGMLLQYSYWRRGLPPPVGILPNWAVVKAKSSKQVFPSLVPSWWGYRARDPTIIGILMPLSKFQGLYDLSIADVPLPDKLPDIAAMMLPAARGLQILHGMGLVHQDMHSANVVISADTGKSMLSDLGLVSKRHDCTGDMCDYCADASIGNRRFPHKAVEGLDAMESDAYRFAELIFTYFFRETDKERKEELLACTEAWQVVRVLEGWLRDAGREVPV